MKISMPAHLCVDYQLINPDALNEATIISVVVITDKPAGDRPGNAVVWCVVDY